MTWPPAAARLRASRQVVGRLAPRSLEDARRPAAVVAESAVGRDVPSSAAVLSLLPAPAEELVWPRLLALPPAAEAV
jgi:hypothetical protein